MTFGLAAAVTTATVAGCAAAPSRQPVPKPTGPPISSYASTESLCGLIPRRDLDGLVPGGRPVRLAGQSVRFQVLCYASPDRGFYVDIERRLAVPDGRFEAYPLSSPPPQVEANDIADLGRGAEATSVATSSAVRESTVIWEQGGYVIELLVDTTPPKDLRRPLIEIARAIYRSHPR